MDKGEVKKTSPFFVDVSYFLYYNNCSVQEKGKHHEELFVL